MITTIFIETSSYSPRLAKPLFLTRASAWNREYLQAGGLISYGANFSDLFRHAADFVDKILHGAKPGGLPVEQPTKFELVINLTVAKALGLKIPEAFLLRADELIE